MQAAKKNSIKRFHGDFIRRSRGEKAFSVFNALLMALLLCFFLFPILNMTSISFSDEKAVLRGDITIYPIGFNGQAYRQIFGHGALWTGVMNSVFVAGVGCVLSLFMLCLAAYPLAFAEFHGKKLYNLLILLTMWFNAGIIPTFLNMSALGLQNSLWALIFNSMLSAYYVVIVRSYFAALPMSIVESARIDGANDYTILLRLIIPLSKPVLATVALWVIVGHWNDYLNALLFISDRGKHTLQMVLKEFVLNAETSVFNVGSVSKQDAVGAAALGQQMRNAVLVVSMIPMIVLYPFVQRYFIAGVTLGAVKG